MPTASARPRTPHALALAEILAELAGHGLVIARVAARLAEVEETAVAALAETAAAAAQALSAPQATLEDALRAGQDADASEAARTAAIARLAAINACYKEAARAVRRAVALHARLAAGPPTPRLATPPFATPPFATAPDNRPTAPRPAPRPANDADTPDRPDHPERGDEFDAIPDDELHRLARRDLAAARRLVPGPGRVDVSPPTPTPGLPATPHAGSTSPPPAAVPRSRRAKPAPDT